MTNELIVGIVLLVVCIGLGLLFSEANHWRKRKNQAQRDATNRSIEDRDTTATADNEGDTPSGDGPPGEG